MGSLGIDREEKFIPQLYAEIDTHLEGQNSERVKAFANNYFQGFPLEEIDGRSFSDVYGITYYWWNYLQCLPSRKPKLIVFNPGSEEAGWEIGHSAIFVLQKNIPFLVDTLRITLNQQNITFHMLHSKVLKVKRNKNDELIDICLEHTKNPTNGGSYIQSEALVYIEITKHKDSKQLEEIRNSIEKALDDLGNVVDDYPRLLEKNQQILSEIKNPKINYNKKDISEAKAFLEWLSNNNFTYLGYSHYQ